MLSPGALDAGGFISAHRFGDVGEDPEDGREKHKADKGTENLSVGGEGLLWVLGKGNESKTGEKAVTTSTMPAKTCRAERMK
jgi:hypothetical protein